MFNNVFTGKKVLVTGHTGFKGSWLISWLSNLGAEVAGYSNGIPTVPSMFEDIHLENKIRHEIYDIRDTEKFLSLLCDFKPDFVFHLAAQPIVSVSYSSPLETISTNTLGTASVLEALRLYNQNCVAVIITSDKAYDNVEQVWGYKENDPMGGKDIYSGSKGAAELIYKSYFNSFFTNSTSNIKSAVARAGNVIGGGDWAKDRIVVDCMNAWSKNMHVDIRCPDATRPWQHVLEPLSGYLQLAHNLFVSDELDGEGFNFGPRAEQNFTVEKLISDLSITSGMNLNKHYEITDNIPFHEAGLLKLNCDKALYYLGWQSTLNYKQTVKFTGDWYKNYFSNEEMFEFTIMQINEFCDVAKSQGLRWTE